MNKILSIVANSCSVLAVVAVCGFAKTPTVSDKCRNEIIELPNTKKNFSAQSFPKDLVVSKAKVEALCKIKFTCPGNNKTTDVGLTVGCVKELPADAGGLADLLKDLGMDAATQATDAVVESVISD